MLSSKTIRGVNIVWFISAFLASLRYGAIKGRMSDAVLAGGEYGFAFARGYVLPIL